MPGTRRVTAPWSAQSSEWRHRSGLYRWPSGVLDREVPLTCGNSRKVTERKPVFELVADTPRSTYLRCRMPAGGWPEHTTGVEPDERFPTTGITTRVTSATTADPRISIVVPALNEALNLAAVLPQLPKVHEVILVDGGSVDGTVEAARRALPGIITVQQTRRGKGNALAAGFARVTGDIVVMFDADGSADPAEIDRSSRPSRRVPTSPRARGSSRAAARRTSRRSGASATVPEHALQRRLQDPLQRPLLRLQRLLGRPDPAARPARPRRAGAQPTAR